MSKCYACGQHKPSKYRIAWERVTVVVVAWWAFLLLQVQAAISLDSGWSEFWGVHGVFWAVIGIASFVVSLIESASWLMRTPDTDDA